MSNLIKKLPSGLLYHPKEEQEKEPEKEQSSLITKVDEISNVIEIATSHDLPTRAKKDLRTYLESKYNIQLQTQDSGLTCALTSEDKLRQGDVEFIQMQNSMYFYRLHGRNLEPSVQRILELKQIVSYFDLRFSQDISPKPKHYRKNPDQSPNESPEYFPPPRDFKFSIKLLDQKDLLIAEIFDCRKKDYEEFSVFRYYSHREELTHALVEGFYNSRWR